MALRKDDAQFLGFCVIAMTLAGVGGLALAILLIVLAGK